MSFPQQPPPLAGVVHTDVRVDGWRWHVATAGDLREATPPVVLLHGWPQHWWCWRKVIPALAREHRVYAPDLRGFGWSDSPPGPYDKEGLAADVVRLLDVLEIDRCVLAGHDWGGFVAWLVALRAPERVERLVALSIIDPWFVPERSVKGLASAWYQIPVMTPGLNRLLLPRVGGLMRRAGAAAFSEQDARLYGGQYERGGHVAAAAAVYRTFLTRELPAIARGRYDGQRAQMPVTVATGTEDPVVKPDRIRGARADDLRVEVLPDAGHFLPEFNAPEVTGLILRR